MNINTTPCRICEEPTSMLGTRLCNNCWEVDTRIRLMRKEAAIEYLEKTLAELKKK